MKHLIVTADDVGLHRGMTLGAIRAHQEGIVTACSVAGGGPELSHAAELLKSCPRLDVGVHLMLVGSRPVADRARVPTLVGRDGAFDGDYRGFVARYALGRISVREVDVEFRAQIEQVLARGLTVCHLNGHQHIHVLPGVFDIVVRLALEYGIPYIRIPDDRMLPGSPSVRRGAVAVLGRLARRAAFKARSAGLRVNRHTIGIADAGHLTKARLRQLIQEVSSTTELVTHPGIDGGRISLEYDWGYEWDAETEALCDRTLTETMARNGVSLVSIRASPDSPIPPLPPSGQA